jgi:hypothetical protein
MRTSHERLSEQMSVLPREFTRLEARMHLGMSQPLSKP